MPDINEPLISICCVCGLVKDKTLDISAFDMRKWRNPTEEEKQIIDNQPGRISHGYCPKCGEEAFGLHFGKGFENEASRIIQNTVFLTG